MMRGVRVFAGLCVLLLSGFTEAWAQYLPQPEEPAHSLRFTHLFTQYNFYNTDSNHSGLKYNYRAHGFSTGVNFRYGPSVSGYVYGGFMDAVDDVTAPVANRTEYDLPHFGGQLAYVLMPNVAIGGSLLVQRIDGDFTTAGTVGDKNGWGVSGSGFVQYSLPFGGLWVTITPALGAGKNRVTQPGLVSPFIGDGITASVGVNARYSLTTDWTVGAGVTPAWVLSESDNLDDRAIGPFHTTVSANTRFRLHGPLWIYGSFNYGFHGTDRDAQSAVVGVSWELGR